MGTILPTQPTIHATQMNTPLPLPILLLLLPVVSSRPSEATTMASSEERSDIPLSVRPRVAVVVGVFSIVFSLTILVLVYAKFCHPVTAAGTDPENPRRPGVGFSGLDKAVIEALPFFPFSMLKGSKQGLECAVCLSRFEDSEILRLLPKCKHAFHIDCVDRWLEGHSSCPLCRCKVEAADAALFNYPTSSRFLFRNPSNRVEADLELYVEREADTAGEGRGSWRTFEHRIVVPDSVFRNRWSDLRSADLTSLGCDVLRLPHGGRTVPGGRELIRGKHAVGSGKRCTSEITSVPRSADVGKEDESVRDAWWLIARRTAERVAGGNWGPPRPGV